MEKEEIKHLANLSSLEFTDEEIETFQKEFNSILNFVQEIENANVSGEIEYDTKSFNELREDEPKQGLTQEEVLLNAPSKKLGSFAVPLMME